MIGQTRTQVIKQPKNKQTNKQNDCMESAERIESNKSTTKETFPEKCRMTAD